MHPPIDRRPATTAALRARLRETAQRRADAQAQKVAAAEAYLSTYRSLQLAWATMEACDRAWHELDQQVDALTQQLTERETAPAPAAQALRRPSRAFHAIRRAPRGDASRCPTHPVP